MQNKIIKISELTNWIFFKPITLIAKTNKRFIIYIIKKVKDS